MKPFTKFRERVDGIETIRFMGSVEKVRGMLIESHGPQTVIGELCEIMLPDGAVLAEVVGLYGNTVQLMPFSPLQGIEIGSPVVARGESLQVGVSDQMLGRVINAMGKPMDNKGPIHASDYYPATAQPPAALTRQNISEQIATGVRAIDGLTPVGKGQRIGIFSGSGVGKSTLLGMIARNSAADVNVIALIGERGREVREFIENDIGEAGMQRSVLVVSTGDTPAAARLKGAYVATAIAEYFRDQGKDVMLLFDSVTRFARAQREIGLSIGEAPATRGFPPSTFSILPRLLERCGASERGTITGFYNILVDGDDMDEPISDNVRGILDGHIVLSRRLAQAYHYPAIEVIDSVSRLASKITPPETQAAVGYMRGLMALYRENEDLINIGAYATGNNPRLDDALKRNQDFLAFLQQEITESSSLADTYRKLSAITSMPVPYSAPAQEPVVAHEE